MDRATLGILLLWLTACGAQEAPVAEEAAEPREAVETRSSVDRAVATTGDIITYKVTVDYDPAYEIELPEPGAEIAGFRIIDIGSEEPRQENGRVVEERWYKLRADLVGSYVLPPVEVAYREIPAEGEETFPTGEDTAEPSAEDGAAAEDAQNPYQTAQTSEIFIEVESVLATAEGDTSDIRDVKPLRAVERTIPKWWFAAGGGGVLLLLLGIYLIWRRSRQEVVVPPRPAHEIAFEALDRLRRTDFEDVELMRLFHFEISEVIRTYVENRFALNATDLTTEEIVSQLDDVRGLDADNSERLRGFLGATDRVKFAAYVPESDEIGQTYESALSFVEATRERPETPPASAEAPPETPPMEAAA